MRVSSITAPKGTQTSQEPSVRVPWGFLCRTAARVAWRRPALWLYVGLLLGGWWALTVAVGLVPAKDDRDPAPWLLELAWLGAAFSTSLALLWLPAAASLESGLSHRERLLARLALLGAACVLSMALVIAFPLSWGWLLLPAQDLLQLATWAVHIAGFALFLSCLPVSGLVGVLIFWIATWLGPGLWPNQPWLATLPVPWEASLAHLGRSTWNPSPWLAAIGWTAGAWALLRPRSTR